MARYQRPPWIVQHVLNPFISFLAGRLGLDMRGAWVLTVRGRRSGQPRSVPVNPLDLNGARYLVAPRGTTEWVRNLRAAGSGTLRKGKTTVTFRAEEIPDDQKPPILREYLRRWGDQVKGQFAVSGPDAPDEDLRRIAPDHPIFRIYS
ncbi:MAG TPA: nitroreductase family deazaflavin-dependent oxidoreductase [Thermomicrobiales bacterium]